MILLFEDILEKKSNVITHICKFKDEKKFPFTDIHYMSICDNYLYGRIHAPKSMQPDFERTIRFNISDPLNPVLDKNFNLKGYVACHNMYIFKDKNNIIRGIGGQHRGNNSRNIFNLNKEFSLYHAKNKMIANPNKLRSNYIKSLFYLIYDYTVPCPYYANGLHLFNIEKNNLVCQNNGLPIISGIHEGRYDGFYGDYDPEYKNLNMSKGGVSVFDSISSIIYDNANDLYILYQRANISRGRRTVQYATSKDLIKWSPFNLINLGNNYDHLDNNIYYSNFYKIDKSSFTVAILPFINFKGKKPFIGVTQNLSEKKSIINHLDANTPVVKNDNVIKIDTTRNNLLLLKLGANKKALSARTIKNKNTHVIVKRGNKTVDTIKKQDKIDPNKKFNFSNNFCLMYSFDSINYKYIGDFIDLPSTGHPYCLSSNHPYIHNNKMYYYFHYMDKITIYTLEKNRYTYITNLNKDASFTTKNLFFDDKKILMNFTIFNSGYVKVQLLDESNVIIPGFSFNDFDEIKSNNSFDYELTWNKKSEIPNKKVKIEINFLNAYIYSFNGNIN